MLLDQEPGMAVAGMADRLTGLMAQVEGAQPDVLLLDSDLMVEPMENLFHDLQVLEQQPEVIVLSADPQIKESVLAAGAIFFICRDAPPDALLPMLNDIRLSKIEKPNNI
jgi:DNA-binding NarL/FixJ family response regulator